jgi:rRNA maturation endonuclease Nob1
MVQFCPKCGTQAPDDEAVFCNKCGTRLPPVIPEKQDIFCQRCGTKVPDDQSAFCNKCGSPIHSISPAQIQVAGIRQAAAASRPNVKKHRCHSCGAPLVDEISDYCNVCGADVRRPAPVTPPREIPPPAPVQETTHPFPAKTVPATPAGDVPDEVRDVPERKNRRPLLKWGLVAIAVVILLAVIAAFITGMIPGIGHSPDETPAPADTPVTVLPTQKTTQTTTPKMTTAPAKVTTKPAATVVTTNASAKVTVNATATITTNTSANVTANVTTTATPAPTPTFPTQPLSIGQSASDGKGKLTLNSITFKEKMGDPTPSYAIGKKYLIVEITYENLQRNVTTEIDLTKMAVKDAGGYAFDQVDDVTLEKPFSVYGKTIPAQENRTGNLLFVVPPEATFLKFSFDFGEQKIAIFQIS